MGPITRIFNSCLSSGVFIDAWKVCSITPIYKSGDRNDIRNYRPIVKQSTLAKLFDSIIHSKLYLHVCSIISNCQHGFMPGRSTCSNLLLVTNDIVKAFNCQSQLDVIYTDFSKAFDKVDHVVLLHKLKLYGITGELLKFFASFLSGRKLFVKMGSVSSNTSVNAWSGIPQGTHCGPLLFLLFINDLPSHFKFTKCLMFADDVKLLLQVDSLSDCRKLQADLSILKLGVHQITCT